MSGCPEISPDHCVHGLIGNASCQACVDSCPRNAWILGEDSLGLDEEACDGCGLCIPACPSGALHTPFPYVIRHIGGQAVALFGCGKSGAAGTEACISCIHALGIRQLLLLYTSGINCLLLAEQDCVACHIPSERTLENRVKQLNRLLRERHRPLIKLLYRPARVWRALLRQEALITRGTLLNRRAFLAGASSSRLLREQMVSMDPLNRPECQTVAPGILLDTESGDQHLPWVPRIEAMDCSGCDACINLCPTQALRYDADEDNACYRIDAPRCNGCGICADVCAEESVHVLTWEKWQKETIPLKSARCNRCGNDFHVPRESQLGGTDLCPVCRSSGSKQLFQVLGAA
ncbi:4Fe-4S binding protein [Thiolapillus sp.]